MGNQLFCTRPVETELSNCFNWTLREKNKRPAAVVTAAAATVAAAAAAAAAAAGTAVEVGIQQWL